MKTKYDWKKIQEFYDEGNSTRDIIRKFGVHNRAIQLASKRSDIKLRSRADGVKIYIRKNKRYRYDWKKIQEFYDNGNSWNDVKREFGVSNRGIEKAVLRGDLKLRTHSEGIRIANKKYEFIRKCQVAYRHSKFDKKRAYRLECKFNFALNEYPDKFDFDLVRKYGWYKAKNRGDNVGGVTRDHLFSIEEGYANNIPPKHICHPANCQLLVFGENASKGKKSTISYDELLERIKNWRHNEN